jgi:hypothetical protein
MSFFRIDVFSTPHSNASLLQQKRDVEFRGRNCSLRSELIRVENEEQMCVRGAIRRRRVAVAAIIAL